jgi:hypothetical protein
MNADFGRKIWFCFICVHQRSSAARFAFSMLSEWRPAKPLDIFSGSNRFRFRLIRSKKIRNPRAVLANAYRQRFRDPSQPIKSLIDHHRLKITTNPLRKRLQLLNRKPRMLIARGALTRTSFKLGIAACLHLEAVIAEVANQKIDLKGFRQRPSIDLRDVESDRPTVRLGSAWNNVRVLPGLVVVLPMPLLRLWQRHRPHFTPWLGKPLLREILRLKCHWLQSLHPVYKIVAMNLRTIVNSSVNAAIQQFKYQFFRLQSEN